MQMDSRANRISVALLLCILLLYWSLALNQLTVLPIVYEDEPWQASTGLKIAREGVFGSDLFAGFGRMEHRYYGYPPGYPLALAFVFRIANVGLFQARWLGVICGTLTLALTFSLARRIWGDPRIAALAGILLLSVHWLAETKLHPTGILFFDTTRLARYDVLVPVFGLASLQALFTAQRSHQQWWYFVAGLLVSASGLTHLYGLFLLPALCILILWSRAQNRFTALALVLLGAALPWLFYGVYILQDTEAFRLQTRGYGERFELLNPNWYLRNVILEPVRYSLDESSSPLFLRAGIFFSAIALAASWVALALNVRKDALSRFIFVPLTLLPLAYALLLQTKFTNYLLLIAPFAALGTAWGFFQLWDGLGQTRYVLVRVALALVLLLVVLEGISRYVGFQSQANSTTRFSQLNAQLQAYITPGSRVLGLQDYWFGWDDYEYRSLAVPIMLINPLWSDAPPTLAQALDAQQPDYILLDDDIREYFKNAGNGIGAQFASWLDANHAHRIAELHDPTYGWFEIYQVERAQ